MKGSRIYILSVILLAVVLMCIQMRLPHDFTWRESYATDDREPYGCFVFDSIMRQTMPHGYEVKNLPISKLSKECRTKKQNVLIAAPLISLSYSDCRSLKRLAESGADIIVAARNTEDTHTDSVLEKEFGIKYVEYDYVTVYKVVSAAKKNNMDHAFDTIRWTQDVVFPQKEYRCYAFITNQYLAVFDESRKGRVLAYTGEKVVAYRMPFGKGSITFVSTSLAFTNYGVISPSISGYAMRLMSQIASRHVVRTTTFLTSPDEAIGGYESPTGYFFKDPPLRLALLVSFLAVVIFMITNARRRQRAIPVLPAKRSNSLEFIRLVGSLYWQSHDNADLVRKKYSLFCDKIRRETGIDLSNVADDGNSFSMLSRHTGIDSDEIKRMILNARFLTFKDTGVSDKELKDAVDDMDRIEAKV